MSKAKPKVKKANPPNSKKAKLKRAKKQKEILIITNKDS